MTQNKEKKSAFPRIGTCATCGNTGIVAFFKHAHTWGRILCNSCEQKSAHEAKKLYGNLP